MLSTTITLCLAGSALAAPVTQALGQIKQEQVSFSLGSTGIWSEMPHADGSDLYTEAEAELAEESAPLQVLQFTVKDHRPAVWRHHHHGHGGAHEAGREELEQSARKEGKEVTRKDRHHPHPRRARRRHMSDDAAKATENVAEEVEHFAHEVEKEGKRRDHPHPRQMRRHNTSGNAASAESVADEKVAEESEELEQVDQEKGKDGKRRHPHHPHPRQMRRHNTSGHAASAESVAAENAAEVAKEEVGQSADEEREEGMISRQSDHNTASDPATKVAENTTAELEEEVDQSADAEREEGVISQQKGHNATNDRATMVAENITEELKDPRSFVYIKVPKTGGSTLAGVCRRIGKRRNYLHAEDSYWLRRINKSSINTSVPSMWANHGKRRQLQHRIDKVMPNAFYLTSVRDPAERCMAAYYHFTVGRRHVAAENTDRKLIHISKCSQSFQASCMRKRVNDTPAEAFAMYDFVLVTERFDESLLAMRKAVGWLNLTLVDLLYLKAKESGKQATDQNDHFEMPVHVPLSEEPQEVRDALATRWVNSDDALIVRLAHQKLDRYGFQASPELSKFKEMLRITEESCRAHFSEDCLWNDNGCGQTCIDETAKKHGWV